MTNAAVIETMAERLAELGGLSPDRVRCTPIPGTATIDDLLQVNEHQPPLCELVDGTLVEKGMGYQESIVAGAILEILRVFVREHSLGLISGPDGMFRLFSGLVRGPDVGFLSKQRLPEGKIPTEPYPSLAPELVVEVLSLSNTKGEMSRKRREYFQAGVRLVWMVDLRNRSVAVYTSPLDVKILYEEHTISGGDVLPGFEVPVAEFFADLENA
jgi:Uma2 family endonuclease